MLAVLILVLVGTRIGRVLVLRDFDLSVEQRALAETLGTVLDVEYAAEPRGREYVRREFARAYLDPERAAQEMEEYSWDVPTVPVPFVGSAPAPGRHANATINEQHFRHVGVVATPKPPGVYRIFVTGGSTAFGSGAPAQDRTIPGYLQARLDRELAPNSKRRYEVINAASPAWTSSQERIWIENRLSELEPDLVVSLSGSNDVHWGERGRDILWFRTHSDQHFVSLLNLVYRKIGAPPVAVEGSEVARRVPPARVTGRLVKNVRLASYALALREVPYVFALQPTLATTAKSLSERERVQREMSESFGPGSTEYFQRCYRAMQAGLSGSSVENLHVLDLAGVFDSEGPSEEIFLDRFHFGDRGNDRLAEQLYRGLLPVLGSSSVAR